MVMFNTKKVATIIIVAGLFFGGFASAYEIEDANVDIKGDFVLEQAKHQVFLKPGEKKSVYISVVNRSDKTMKFRLEVEDFKGTRDSEQTVVLLGDDKGPYTLKDYLKPEIDSFVIDSRKRIKIRVDIEIPYDAQPGGRYGSVLVLNEGPVDKSGNLIASNKTSVLTRLGALFFVRVEGDVTEKGKLENFKLSSNRKIFSKGPVDFEILYSNDGNVHLTPYGEIEIYNIVGRKVGIIEIDPFFVLPDSLRTRVVKWDREFLVGKYKAVLKLNRGYIDNEDKIDELSVVFWVLPWKYISGGLLVIFILVLLIAYIKSKFEIKIKRS